MSANDSDLDILNLARNKLSYGDGEYKNSLVEWTLSDEWTQPSWVPNPKRGTLVLHNGDLVQFDASFSGEITNAR